MEARKLIWLGLIGQLIGLASSEALAAPLIPPFVEKTCKLCSDKTIDWQRYRNFAFNDFRRQPLPWKPFERLLWRNYRITGTAAPGKHKVLVSFRIKNCPTFEPLNLKRCLFEVKVQKGSGEVVDGELSGAMDLPVHPDELPYPEGDPNYQPPPPPICTPATPTAVASLPLSDPAASAVLIVSAGQFDALNGSSASMRTPAIDGRPQRTSSQGGLPRLWVQDRGPGYMTSRLAPVRYENGTLRVYYTAHTRNGMQMQKTPKLRLEGVSAAELPGRAIRGIIGLDLWEDGKAHAVKLWLADGTQISEGAVVDRIREGVQADYGEEPKRHRLIRFQRFYRASTGELVLYGESFAYQPLCGCPPDPICPNCHPF